MVEFSTSSVIELIFDGCIERGRRVLCFPWNDSNEICVWPGTKRRQVIGGVFLGQNSGNIDTSINLEFVKESAVFASVKHRLEASRDSSELCYLHVCCVT